MVEREDLIEALVERDVDEMDMDDLVEFVELELQGRYDSYSDEELREHAASYYPEMLEELDELSEGV